MPNLYPRTISVRRQGTAPQVGQVGFGGDAPVQETVIFTSLCASIQYSTIGRGNQANLPTDSRRSTWLIMLPANSPATLGTITENDIIQDDVGKRYQVYAADYQVLGYNIRADLLNV